MEHRCKECNELTIEGDTGYICPNHGILDGGSVTW